MAKVTQYETKDGVIPFKAWFDSLPTKVAPKVTAAIAQMEAGNFGDHNSVGGGVWERRIHFEKGYRIYFGKDGVALVVLLCGGTKARQQNDIDFAKQLWTEYKARKKATKARQTKATSRTKKKRKR